MGWREWALLLMLLAAPVAAQEARTWGPAGQDQSFMRIGPSDAPGAVAEVTFYNDERHNSVHRGMVEWGGVRADFEVRVDAGARQPVGSPADVVVIMVGPDFIVVPDIAEVPERSTQVFVIYPLESVGM